MSEEKALAYKYGITGYVELHKKIAKKYSEFDQLYWLKEHAIFMYMWAYRTDNIIKYESSCILTKSCPIKGIPKKYYETILKRHPATLHDRRLYRDGEIIQFLLDMSSALKFLHDHNISHRDIKPSNITISDLGRAILIDFSHAHRMVTPLVKPDPYVVTYYYRAPEIFQYQDTGENPYDSSIDIYSLGMVLIEVLTGTSFAQYYTNSVKNHGISEHLYGVFLQDAKKSFEAIKEYFNAGKRNFVYIKQYWEWIVKMIASEPGNRITAEELYMSVKSFANRYKITYVEPINGIEEVDMIKLEGPPTESTLAQDDLKIKCIQYLYEIRRQYRMLIDPLRITDVIYFMIKDNYITQENYKIQIVALSIILETVVFDGVTDLEDYGELDCKEVIDGIIDIVRKYDQHLFGKNALFTYMYPI